MLLKAFFLKKNHSKTFTFYKLGGTNSKEPACQFMRHERHGFDPWVRKIPWKKTWQPTLLPGESPWTEEHGGLQSMGVTKVGRDWVTKPRTAQYRHWGYSETYNELELGQALGDGEGQGGLVLLSTAPQRVDTTGHLNSNHNDISKPHYSNLPLTLRLNVNHKKVVRC